MKTSVTSLFTVGIAAMLLLFVSCGKDGDVGPIGPQGEQGPQGEIGIPGKDGAVILNGEGAPADDLGNMGDMYLDKATSNLYGPKSDEGWGTPLDLKGQNGDKGDKGDKGNPGSEIHKGSGAPSTTFGKVGDYYLDTETGDFYGPKSIIKGQWGEPINLKGAANVVSSTWFSVTNWYRREGNREAVSSIPVPMPLRNAVNATDLASFVEGGGVILMYYRENHGTIANTRVYHSLPYSIFINGDDVAPVIGVDALIQYNWYTMGSSLSLSLKSFDGNLADYYVTERDEELDVQFRYVLIPAGQVIAAAVDGRSVGIDQLKAMSYKEAGTVFGWED